MKWIYNRWITIDRKKRRNFIPCKKKIAKPWIVRQKLVKSSSYHRKTKEEFFTTYKERQKLDQGGDRMLMHWIAPPTLSSATKWFLMKFRRIALWSDQICFDLKSWGVNLVDQWIEPRLTSPNIVISSAYGCVMNPNFQFLVTANYPLKVQ